MVAEGGQERGMQDVWDGWGGGQRANQQVESREREDGSRGGERDRMSVIVKQS